mmetsp:Transcript_15499/g.28170  ORF Transcript_15499/g.28170 Transcript_15499/m.28170 type:complete len:165 (-) Transcript_15499:364-858(-)|eukprot:CAMPEP_0201867092 /NCGR_PEP_ID=MMETSP0902-20130614/1467_1 /ASSEMBLY_ACC=CAM_ASM_000551 /TAXON_ID=420261 /ORGANISM="Thalassiosira antarctica, Strain CCMP982" /LENGTH=164 /DNA_ID=CAMNT_0048392207 /DNA_START=144 /DNA_END=638 /DNA_ORIENTATION=-
MTHHPIHSAPAAIVAAEPDDDNAGPHHHPARTAAVDEPDHTVEVRHRGRLASLLSMMSCRNNSSISNSIHFHAQRIEDSVHVLVKHDREACKRRGQPEKVYTPRAPLSERLIAVHKMEDARHLASHASTPIEAREEDGESEMDRDILAAVSMADCVSGSDVAGR